MFETLLVKPPMLPTSVSGAAASHHNPRESRATMALGPPFADNGNSLPFFDGFLMIGITWFNNSAFYPDGSHNYTVQQDWLAFLDLQLTMGAENLDRASNTTGMEPKFALTIPFPDPRAEVWGVTEEGRALNLSVAVDRIAAACWFVDMAVSRLLMLGLRHASFVGFYWFNEHIIPEDFPVVQAVAQHIHSQVGHPKLVFFWIPYFEAEGWQSWQELGFDFATLQPNWAFHSHVVSNHTLTKDELFARVANDTHCHGLGVEMELPLSVRNPQILNESWRASFDAYTNASKEHGWGKTMRTYYYGNDFVLMAAAAPDYFVKLYDAVAGVQL